MKNLHGIMGAKFQHSKPNLCPLCEHCKPYGEWEEFCTAHEKVLSAPKVKKGRCKDFKVSNQKIAIAMAIPSILLTDEESSSVSSAKSVRGNHYNV